MRNSLPIFAICLLGCLLLPGCRSAEKEIILGELRGVSYYPESFDEPMIVTTYAVSAADVLDFEAFLKDKDILSLVNRKDSDDFVTDYSPWGYSIVFDKSSVGGSRYETYNISQYKEYSDKDRKLLEEFNARFLGLQGKVISEVVIED